MSDFDNKLDKHVEKVLEMKRNIDKRQLTLAELKEIDLSMGITEQEWDTMMNKANTDAELAQSHFKYNNFQDAFKTAEAVTMVNPYHAKAHLVMAEAALRIYQTEDDDDFIEKAEKAAREALKLNSAEKKAIQILAQLNKNKSVEKNKKSKMIRTVAIVAVVILGVLAFLLWPQGQKSVDKELKFELIEAEEGINAAWAQVENVIARRNQLVPQLMELANTEDATTIQLSNEIIKIRKEISNSSGDENIVLQSKLQTKIKELTATISANTQNDNTKVLMVQIEGAVNRIAVEGKRYNDKVKDYNILIKKHGADFPEFKIKPYFKGK